MYLKHFGLARLPFPATPDSGSYYAATEHEHALAELLQNFEMGDGTMLLHGDAGTGKTLLCHCLIERLPADCTVAFLTNSNVESRRDLLQALLYDLSLPYESGTEQELRLRLTEFLLTNLSDGKRALMLIDEAHNLSTYALEELRLLGNLEAGRRKAVQIVLIAQPALLQTLAQPRFISLNQRLTVRVPLPALLFEEAIDYLLHHVRIAGGRRGDLFSDEALSILVEHTNGIPRLLNQAGHQALLTAYQYEVEHVDAEVMLEALNTLGWVADEAVETESYINDASDDESDEDTEESTVAYRMYQSHGRMA